MNLVKHSQDHDKLGFPVLTGTRYVDSFGAVGDGVAIDTSAILNASFAAGANGTLIFTPGKTYLIDGELNSNQNGAGITGQRWVLHGAKIKRQADITGTTTATLNTGTSTPTVSPTDAAKFRVGSYINVKSGTNYASVSRRITSINLSTGVISVAGTLDLTDGAGNTVASFAAGATVFTAFRMIVGNNDMLVQGGEYDGNRANCTTFPRWDLHCALFLAGSRCKGADLYVHDEVGDGVIVGGMDSYVRNSRIIRTGGNGIHFTGPQSRYSWAESNSVRFTNLGGASVGHANGGIILSDDCTDISINSNAIEGVAIGAAFGSIDSSRNRGVTIAGNTVRNCAGVMSVCTSIASASGKSVTAAPATCAATNGLYTGTIAKTGIFASLLEIGSTTIVGQDIELSGYVPAEYNGIHTVISETADTLSFYFRGSATSPATTTGTVTSVDENPKDVTFTGNRCHNSGNLNIQSGFAYDLLLGPKNVSVTGNIFVDCNALIWKAHGVSFANNRWNWSADKLSSVITITDSTDVEVHDHISGGLYGVQIGGTVLRNIAIGGTLRNQSQFGMLIQNNATNLWANVKVDGATIAFDADGRTSGYVDTNRWCAASLSGNVIFTNNTLYSDGGAMGGYNGAALYFNGANPTMTTVVAGNTIRGSATNGPSSGPIVTALFAAAAKNIVWDGNKIGAIAKPQMYPVAGGTGYAVNDVLTVVGGTGTAATLTVKQVTAGVINQAELTTNGVYTVFPSDPVSVTGGTGTAATFNLPHITNTISIT